MADFSQIIQEINDDITTNGVGAITGAKLNEVLRDMIAAVNAEKQDQLTIDATPTEDSINPVQSGGVYGALQDKADKVQLATTNDIATFGANGNIKDSGVSIGNVAMDANVVHKNGDETISGEKTFADKTIFNNEIKLIDGNEIGATFYSSEEGKIEFYGSPSEGTVQLKNITSPSASSDAATKGYVDNEVAGKQDVISDLAAIRSGAAAGATAYQKPFTGIPKTDLSSSVQSSLGKADTAFQKPSGGIPLTDLASGVQTSLGKADTAVQQVTVGTTTTGNAGTNASVTNSGTATNPVLDFTIPRGADAVNPFKGWYDSANALPANPAVGDYAYVKGATVSDPVAIYECTTAGTWTDSGRTFNPANNQEFASGEDLNTVHIVNDMTTGGVHDVLSAEQGKTLNTQVSQLDQDVNDLLTHNREITPLPITLNLDHFYNGFGLVVGSTFTDGANAAEGIACVSVNVAEGEKYHIKGKGNAYAYKQYWLVDSANKVTRITSESNIDIEITIQSGEAKLYCNFRNYDSLTEGLWFLEENWLDSKVNAIYQDDIKKDIASPTIVEGYAYNNGGDPIGFIYTSAPTQYSGVAYCLVPIIQGIEVTLFGVGSPNAYRYYMFTDKNGAIIEKSSETINSRASGLKLTIPSNARLLWVNFSSYDSSTDRVEVKYSFGINSLYNDSKPFSGKNIVCFGDSLTEFSEQFNRKMHYSDYIAEITGANVINVGIGGTRLSRRATPVAIPTTAPEAYAALDIVSLVEAVSDNDYSYATAAATYLDNNGSSGRMAIVQRLSAIEWAKIDAVTILGGSNDWFGGASIGVSGGNDKGTVFGAINEIVRMLLTAYPSIKLYWFTPTVRWIGTAPRTEENWCDNYAVNGKTLREFSAAIFGEVVNNHIPTCDMYNTLGWTMYNFQEYFLDSDGTHPYKGFEPIGEKMVAFLNANRTF